MNVKSYLIYLWAECTVDVEITFGATSESGFGIPCSARGSAVKSSGGCFTYKTNILIGGRVW